MASTIEIHKEIDLVQDVIKRMAANSFEVKKWLVGILTALVVFKNVELIGGYYQIVWLLFLPVICFWYLDAFFLSKERLYREVYKWVIKHRNESNNDYLYDLNTFIRTSKGTTENLVPKNNRPISVMFSKTLFPFYLVPILFILVLMYINYLNSYFANCG